MADVSDVAEAAAGPSAGFLGCIASSYTTLSVMILNMATTLNRVFEVRARAMGLCRQPTSLLERVYAYWKGPAPCTIRDVLVNVLRIIGRKVGIVLYGLGLVLYGLFCIPYCVVMLLYEGLKYCAKSDLVWILLEIVAAYIVVRVVLRLLLRLIVTAARCALIVGLVLSPVIALAILNPAGTSTAVVPMHAGSGSTIAQAALQQFANHPVISTTVIGVALAPVVGPLMLSAAGFTASGVAAGSLAAGAHSMIGNVIAGSIFSGAQAAGATGIIPAMGLAIAGGFGGAAALVASTLAGVLG